MHVPGKKLWWSLAALAAGAVVLMLYFFPPDQYSFYPRCAFYAVTGWKCPGCGGLRAAHYALHGDFAAAFRSNPLIVALLPVLGIGSVFYGVRRRLGRPMPAILEHPAWLWALVIAVILFAVMRNLS